MNIVLQSDDLGASAIALLEIFVKLHKGSFGTTQESHSCQFMPASVVWFCLVLVFVGMISQKYLPKTLVPSLSNVPLMALVYKNLTFKR